MNVGTEGIAEPKQHVDGSDLGGRRAASQPGVVFVRVRVRIAGRVLKQRRPQCRVVAVEPASAAVLSGGSAGAHHIPGLGAGFIPEILNRSVIDEVIPVSEEQAVKAQLDLASREGIAAGISSGAALAAALTIAARPESKGRRIVVVLPDGGERYAAGTIFNELLRSVRG